LLFDLEREDLDCAADTKAIGKPLIVMIDADSMIADLAEHDPEKKEVTEALADICEPSGLHCQAPVFA